MIDHLYFLTFRGDSGALVCSRSSFRGSGGAAHGGFGMLQLVEKHFEQSVEYRFGQCIEWQFEQRPYRDRGVLADPA